MTAVIDGQTNLLDLLKPAEPEGPFICRWCGAEEPNWFLLRNNHWADSPRAEQDRECIAMNLTRNHVNYWCMVLKGQHDAVCTCRGVGKSATARFKHTLEHLREDVNRARQVWPFGQLPWLEPMVEDAGIPVDEVTPASEENEWGASCPDNLCGWSTREEGYATRQEAMDAYHQHRQENHR